MEAVLKINKLNKSFDKHHVIKDLSMEIYRGEVFGFLGPNGSGKSTTIKMITGFLAADSGTITVEGIDTRFGFEVAMKNIGGIVENPDMYLNLSGRDNLKLYANLQGGITNERINEIIETVGMTDRIDGKMKTYSMGMKQRVGLAAAILHEPKLIILDEPTNGLDPAGIKHLRDILVSQAHENNAAVLVSSHLLSEMELMCDRIGIIQNGVLEGIYSLEELKSMNNTNETVYIIQTDDTKLALEALSKYADKIKSTTENTVEIKASEDEIPDIIKTVSKGKAKIYGISKSEKSLEQAFIDITGGGNQIG